MACAWRATHRMLLACRSRCRPACPAAAAARALLLKEALEDICKDKRSRWADEKHCLPVFGLSISLSEPRWHCWLCAATPRSAPRCLRALSPLLLRFRYETWRRQQLSGPKVGAKLRGFMISTLLPVAAALYAAQRGVTLQQVRAGGRGVCGGWNGHDALHGSPLLGVAAAAARGCALLRLTCRSLMVSLHGAGRGRGGRRRQPAARQAQHVR